MIGTHPANWNVANVEASQHLAQELGVPLNVHDALRMATSGGAEVLGLDEEIGSLTPGKKADLQVIDTQALNFAPEVDWASQVVFNAQPVNVQWVFVNGVPLKKDGKVTGDNGRVTADAQAAADRVRKYLGR